MSTAPAAALSKLEAIMAEIYWVLPVTQRFFDDFSIDLAPWLNGKIAEKFARAEATRAVRAGHFDSTRIPLWRKLMCA